MLAKQSAENHSAPSFCGALSSCGRSPYENFGHGIKLNKERSIEQRYSIKFCVRLGKMPTENLPLIKEAYKDKALSKAQVFRWHGEFRNGQKSVEDLERGGRSPTTSDESIAKVKDLLNSFPSFLSLSCALVYGSIRVHQPSFLTINDGLSSADPSLLRCFCQKSLLKGVHISPDLQRSPGHHCVNETPGLSIGLHFCKLP